MEAIGSEGLTKLKIIFLGESAVGKTTVITKFVDRCFVETSVPTIGIDFTGRTMIIEGRPVRIQIWDTAGQERFRSLIPSYIREANGAIVMFDLSDRMSFIEVRKWVKLAEQKNTCDVAIILCGNKSDKSDREVTEEEAQQLADELHLSYLETSARSNHNINSLFELVSKQALLLTHPSIREERGMNRERTVILSTTSTSSTRNHCSC